MTTPPAADTLELFDTNAVDCTNNDQAHSCPRVQDGHRKGGKVSLNDFDADVFKLVMEIGALEEAAGHTKDEEAKSRDAIFASVNKAAEAVLQQAADASGGKLFHRSDQGTEHWVKHVLGFADQSGRALSVEVRRDPPIIKFLELSGGGDQRELDIRDDSIGVENRIRGAVREYLTRVRDQRQASLAPKGR